MKPAKPQSATMDEQTFIPDTMRALYYSPPPTATTDIMTVDGPNIPSKLIFDTDFPTPKPSPSQYLIKVLTAAFSHDELRIARSLNPTKSVPQIPLHNICGTVISTPTQDHWNEEGPKFKVDDIVFGLISRTRDGAAADYVLATEDELARKPKNISAAEAATIPTPALTAWQALFDYSGFDQTQTVSGHFRFLVTNAYDSEVGRQAIQLLRSRTIFPHARPWICATCSSAEHEKILRTESHVNEVIVAPLPLSEDFDLAAVFRDHCWKHVDIVIDCVGGKMFQQAHSPNVVKPDGVVLTAVDPTPAQTERNTIDDTQSRKKGLLSRFIAVRPDGEGLSRIAMLVEENILRGRVESIVDLVNGPDILSAGAAGAAGGRRGEMMVFRVNP